MKKLVMVSLVLLVAFSIVFAGSPTGIKNQKAVRVGVERVSDNTTSQPAQTQSKPIVQKITSAPADGIILGNTDYDYGWNSGTRRNIVLDASGKVHFQWMNRNGALASPLNRRAIEYQTYDPATSTLSTATDVKPKSVAATGFGAVDVFQSGDAAGIAIVCGHANAWFAIDAGPGAANFTTTTLRSGILDPSVTIDPVTQAIYWNDTYDANRSDIFFQKSVDFGGSWTVPGITDTQLVVRVAGSQFGLSSIDNKVLVAPNGDLYIVTCIYGSGSINSVPPAHPDSADRIGYFKSTDKGNTWAWTTISVDGSNVTVGSETVQNYFENFGSQDAVIDKDNNLHVVAQLLADKMVIRTEHVPVDTVYPTYFGMLYWKTGQTGWKLISDPATAHIGDYDSSYYQRSNNAIGYCYPAITLDPSGNGVFAAWSQSRVISGHIDVAWNGIVNYDLWYAYSNNLGTSWSASQKLSNTDGGLFVSAAPALTKPNGTTYRAHFVYLADTSAGNSTAVTTGAPLVNYIYRTVDFSSATGVNENSAQIVKFSVDQNFPNPFNPTTEIRYEIGTQSQVSLKVYNLMGQEVAELVNEVQNAGNHNVTFDASNLASGVYLYKLQSGSFVETKKMTLIK